MTRSPNRASPARGSSHRLEEPKSSAPQPPKLDEEKIARVIAEFADSMIELVQPPGRVSLAEATAPAREIISLIEKGMASVAESGGTAQAPKSESGEGH